MRLECRERFSHHRGLVVRARRTCRDACRDRYLAISFEVGGGENVPSIHSIYATRNFTYLVRGPWSSSKSEGHLLWQSSKLLTTDILDDAKLATARDFTNAAIHLHHERSKVVPVSIMLLIFPYTNTTYLITPMSILATKQAPCLVKPPRIYNWCNRPVQKCNINLRFPRWPNDMALGQGLKLRYYWYVDV